MFFGLWVFLLVCFWCDTISKIYFIGELFMRFEILDLSCSNRVMQWDLFVYGFGKEGYHQTSAHIQALISAHDNYDNKSIIALNENDEIVGVLPFIGIKSMLFGKVLVSMPFYNYGGALTESADVLCGLYSEAARIAVSHGYDKIQIRSSQPLDDSYVRGGWGELTHKVNMVLPLPDDLNKIGAGNAKKRIKLRSQSQLAVRRSKELNIEVLQRFGGVEIIDDFYAVFSEKMRDLGTPVQSKLFFIKMLEILPSELTVVYWNEKPVGCGFLFNHDHGTRISIPWASTLSSVNHLSINAYMYFNILQKCIEGRCEQFDFGRSSVGSGTFKFKEQWGAIAQPSYWHELHLGSKKSLIGPSSDKESAVQKVWKLLPLPMANFLGPLLMKYIPA
jgi:serine/alanine adding enzyme